MAGIPYELDLKDTMGPKGKTPWISYKGAHIADSHFCMQFLNKQFDINLNRNSSTKQLAVARACRILLEEHFTWGRAQYRWIENSSSILQVSKPPSPFKFSMPFISSNIKGRMEDNGIGKHTPTEIYQMTEQDLYTVSTLLGNQPFLGGESPCEDDAALFGNIAQVIWGMPGSSFEKLLDEKLRNLNEYCYRMKDRFYPDWDKCLDKA